MGIKKKATEKVIKTIAKKVNVDKIIDNAIDKVSNSIEKGITNSSKIILEKKAKKIEVIKNYKVKKNSEDIINFLIEAKRNIRTKDIEPEEYNMWFLKVEEVYEKAQEWISDKKTLDKITSKYEEINRIKKTKNIGWIAFILIYVVIGICVFFSFKGLFFIGLGISILVASIILFLYFNIDFSNIKNSIKCFKYKETTENEICLAMLSIGVLIIIFVGIFSLANKEEEKVGYKNYYDESVEKFNVSVEVNFKDNLMINKCDITLKLYDIEKFFEHGEDKTFEIELPKGTHKIEFAGNDDTEVEKLIIEGDTKVKYKLECLSGGIEIKQESNDN